MQMGFMNSSNKISSSCVVPVEFTHSYASGQTGYQEWLISRQELLSARLALLDSADESHRLRIEIEQLTAEPLLTVK